MYMIYYPRDPMSPPSSASVIEPSLSESKALKACTRPNTWHSVSIVSERSKPGCAIETSAYVCNLNINHNHLMHFIEEKRQNFILLMI